MQDPDLLDVALHLPAAAPPLGVPWHSLRMACLGGGWFKAVYSLELFVTPSLASTLVKPSFQTRTEYMTQQQFKEKNRLAELHKQLLVLLHYTAGIGFDDPAFEHTA